LQRNFGILLILWCSFKLWWNFCLDQNFSYKVKGPFSIKFLTFITHCPVGPKYQWCKCSTSIIWSLYACFFPCLAYFSTWRD
jgi:hypothetical protein